MTESYRVRILETHNEDAYTGTELGEYIIGKIGIFTPTTSEYDEYFNTPWGQDGYVAGDFVRENVDRRTTKELYCFYAVRVERLEWEDTI